MNTFMPNLINNGFNGFRGDKDDERHFALPLLAGLAITAPFWAGGFYGRRCCPPYPYPLPTPFPQPYPVPTPYPAPYGGGYGYGAGGIGTPLTGGYGAGIGAPYGAAGYPLANRYLYPSPYNYYNRIPYTIY